MAPDTYLRESSSLPGQRDGQPLRTNDPLHLVGRAGSTLISRGLDLPPDYLPLGRPRPDELQDTRNGIRE